MTTNDEYVKYAYWGFSLVALYLAIVNFELVLDHWILSCVFVVFIVGAWKFNSLDKDFFKNVALLVVTLLVFLLCMEVVLRILPIQETNWFGNGLDTADFYSQIDVNSLGFRGPEVSSGASAQTMRVALVGDSFVFGSPIEDYSKTFASLMGDFAGENVELVNLGVPGFNTHAQLLTYYQTHELLNYDKAILFYFMNDAEESALNEVTQVFYTHTIPGSVGEFLYDNSRVYYFFESRFDRVKQNMGWLMTYDDYMHSTYENKEYVAFHQGMLREFFNTFQEGEVAVVIIPMLHNFENYQYGYVHTYITQIAGETGVPVIDLYDLFNGMDEEKLIVNQYDYHFSEHAHKLAADYINQELALLGFYS